MDPTVARNFAIALLIGALVGIEREKRKAVEPHIGVAGLRTFILIAEAGAVSAWLAAQLQAPWIFVATVLAVAGVVTAGYLVQARDSEAARGLTTEIAAVTVCLLGGTCLFGYPGIAVALAIATSALLAYKQPLHRVVAGLNTDDIYAALKLLIATFVVLPLLPNRTVDPWGALNPYSLWWLVILISALSLVGYVAVRWLGPSRGTTLTGFSGGLVSSTAVTLSFARRSREEGAGPELAGPLAAGITLAWAVMFVRMIVLTALVSPGLARQVAQPLAVLAVVCTGLAAAHVRGRNRETSAGAPAVALSNPFSLTAATKFAALFASVLLVVALVQHYFPGQGLYVLAALAGLTDVDAITLSMAGYANKGGDVAVAAHAVLIAALSNTIVKAGLVAVLGAAALKTRVLATTGALLASASIALFLLR
jgi:uncharacterized membrane protein (DUF4010 family)